ncbi:uncharacterized protein [Nicotiana tomentosiformis]|uniref:uncharacterized protein n=1 Tax=Nicotiana tomentosiformis TaxID=4098 RepID=UPI00388CA57C
MNVQELLVIGDSDLLVHQVLGEWDTKNTKILPSLHYVQELIKRFTKIEFKHVPRIQNEFTDALATLYSMIQYPNKNFIDPIPIGIHKQPAYCTHVEEDLYGNTWFHDINEYLENGEYLENATHTQKRTLRRFASYFFQSGGTMYRRTLDLGLLRCVDSKEASTLLEEIHSRTCGPHMNDFVLAKKILRAGPQMNEAVEAANKNIKEILKKIVDNYKQWNEKLPFALLGYRTTVRTSTGGTPHLLVYGTELVISAEVEIPSLRIIQEAMLSDAEWVRNRYEQLALTDGKKINAVCHSQLYQNIMARALNKKVRSRRFTPGQLVLKRIFPYQDEARGKFLPNWQGPYMVHRILTGRAFILAEMDGEELQPYEPEIEKQLRQLRKERNLIEKIEKVGESSTKEDMAGDDDNVDLAAREAAQLKEKATRDAEEATLKDAQIAYDEERARRMA